MTKKKKFETNFFFIKKFLKASGQSRSLCKGWEPNGRFKPPPKLNWKFQCFQNIRHLIKIKNLLVWLLCQRIEIFVGEIVHRLGESNEGKWVGGIEELGDDRWWSQADARISLHID